MSRSYKKQPFMAITGRGSAKRDKVQAHKGERRAHKAVIHNAIKTQDYDVLLPHRRECTWNNVYSWNRDGKQRYTVPTDRDWHDHLKALDPDVHCQYEWMYEFHKKYDSVWPPEYYVEMMRK